MQVPVIFSMQRGATTLALRQQQHKQQQLLLLPPQQIQQHVKFTATAAAIMETFLLHGRTRRMHPAKNMKRMASGGAAAAAAATTTTTSSMDATGFSRRQRGTGQGGQRGLLVGEYFCAVL